MSCGTDMYPAISLAYESSEDIIMQKPPRTKKDKLVGIRTLINTYLTMGIF
ncbi:MAG: cation transporting ATPase C-terminal domain-containing protein [bacterium]